MHSPRGWFATLPVVVSLLVFPGRSMAAWPAEGLVVVPGSPGQFSFSACTDEAFGAYVAWVDPRAGDHDQIRVKRIDDYGNTVAGWPDDGLLVSDATGSRCDSLTVLVDHGNAWLYWLDRRSGYNRLYLSAVEAAGTISTGYGVGGQVAFGFPGAVTHPYGYVDETGALVVGGQYCYGVGDHDALVAKWRRGGANDMFVGVASYDDEIQPVVAPDRTNPNCLLVGYTTWTGSEWDLHVARIAMSGFDPTIVSPVLAPAVSADGKCDLQLRTLADGRMWLAWSDAREGTPRPFTIMLDSLLQVDPDFAPHGDSLGIFTVGATSLTSTLAGSNPWLWLGWIASSDYGLRPSAILLDTTGGAHNGFISQGWQISMAATNHSPAFGANDEASYVVWNEGAARVTRDYNDNYVNGSFGSAGLPVATPCASVGHLEVILTGPHPDAIVLWEDDRDYDGIPEVRAAYVDYMGSAVAARASLVSSRALEHGVALEWELSGAFSVTVERSGDGIAWVALGEAVPDPAGRVRFEDTGVRGGDRVAYRLVAGGHALSLTWIDVPVAAEFALAGARPNPSPRDGLTLAFSLRDASAATLELFDAAGRRVLHETVGGRGAGRHTLRVGGTLAPGLYLARLSGVEGSRTARVCVIG